MNGFLLDTNVPSELTRPRSDPKVERWLEDADDEQLFFSVVSLGEILKGVTILPESRRREELQRWLDDTLRPWFAGRILPVTEPIAGRRQLKGKTITVTDSFIAATALHHDLAMVSRNGKDFGDLGVPVLNPWDL